MPHLPPNRFVIRGDHAVLLIDHLGSTREVLMDLEDLESVTRHRWCIARTSPRYLQVRRNAWVEGQQRTEILARFLMDAPDGMFVDHINRNPLDMRRHNMRVVKPSLNNQNRGPGRNNKTGLRGVTLTGGKFIARVNFQKKIHNLGTFDTPEKAAEAARLFRIAIMPGVVEDCPKIDELRKGRTNEL